MSATCPCCGAPVAAETPLDRAIRAARLTPREQRILRIVARRPGITGADLTDAVYADDPDGGPMWAYHSVLTTVYRMRRKLAESGVSLVSRPGSDDGYRLAFGGAA